ncbi:MAG: SIR2 family protein [Acidimicrobiales bacterium]
MCFDLRQEFRPWDDADKDVFILGAGFSIAAYNDFPSTDRLGTMALGKVRKRNRLGFDLDLLPEEFTNSQFELWLAQLAEDQPYLSLSENLRNRALFVEVTYAIREVILEAEENARGNLKNWLSPFLRLCGYRGSQIITLNYDSLVDSVTKAGPATRTQITGSGSTRSNVWKLHGSISKWWAPNDPTGATIQEVPIRDSEDRPIIPRGLEPFIIPPISGKAAFYRNPKVRELWTEAYDALLRADRVLIVGYSFPAADISMASLLQSSLGRRTIGKQPEVEVINLDPVSVESQLDRVGVSHTVTFDGESSVANFVDSYITEASKYVIRKLREDLKEQHFETGQVSVKAEIAGVQVAMTLSMLNGMQVRDRSFSNWVNIQIQRLGS